ERVRERDGRPDPLQPVILQAKLAKERRDHRHGMDGGADVVREAGFGKKLWAATAADARVPLQDDDRQAGQAEDERSGEPVGAGADYSGIVVHPVRGPWARASPPPSRSVPAS